MRHRLSTHTPIHPDTHARTVPGTSLADLELEQVNRYIERLNRPVRVETLKADLAGARPFLERQGFVREGEVTQLGLLTCGADPAAYLGDRCRVRLMVDAPTGREEGLLAGPLPTVAETCERFLARRAGLEAAIAWPLVQHALLHRDYTLPRPITLTLRPECSLTITYPGAFEAEVATGLLAEVLARYGIEAELPAVAGWCLDHGLNPPEYSHQAGDVTARVVAGSLVDEPVRASLAAHDRYLLERTEGTLLTHEQERLLAYALKSAWARARGAAPLALPPGARPEAEELERWGLLRRSGADTTPDPVLIRRDYPEALLERIGPAADELDALNRAIMNAVYRYGAYSRKGVAPGRGIALLLWCERPAPALEADQLEPFCLRVRKRIARLRRAGFLQSTGSGYRLAPDYRSGRLF